MEKKRVIARRFPFARVVAVAALALGPTRAGAVCFCDLNGDCFVDGIDADLFNNLFETGDTAADLNGDGFVDGIDYDAFFNAFEHGGCDPLDITGDGQADGRDLCCFTRLYYLQSPRADFDCDGLVNAADLDAFTAGLLDACVDWNKDGSVDCADFELFCQDVGAPDEFPPRCDLSGDCTVDAQDRALFTGRFDARFGPGHLACAPCPAPGTVYFCHSGLTGAMGLWGADIATSDPVDPADANTGTDPALPVRSLRTVSGLPASGAGDTIYLAGRHYIDLSYAGNGTGALDFTDMSGLTIKQWPGMDAFVLYCCVKIGAGWTDAGGGVFVSQIEPGLSIATFVHDWDDPARIDGAGFHRAHLPMLAGAPEAIAAANTPRGGVHYDSGSGLVTLGNPAGAANPSSPAANGVAYVVRGLNGIAFHVSDARYVINSHNTIDGLRISLVADTASTSPLGSAIYIQNGGGCVVRNCEFADSGLHAVSFGTHCRDNVIADNTYIGEGPGGIFEVFNPYGVTQGISNTASGCRSYRSKIHLGTLLAYDGSLVTSNAIAGGVICHGGAPLDTRCVDVEWVDPQIVGYVPPDPATINAMVPFTLANAPAPLDWTSPASYGARVRQTDPGILAIAGGVGWPDQNITGNAALINLRMRFDRMPSYQSQSATFALAGLNGTHAQFGCEVVTRLENPGAPVSVFSVGAGTRLVLVNPSVYDAGAGNPAQDRAMVSYSGGGQVFVYGGILGYRSGGSRAFVCSGDETLGPGHRYFSDTVYFNIGAGAWSQNPAFDTAAEWLAEGGIDPAGIDGGAANAFDDATGASLAPTEPMRLLRRWITPHTTRGVNGYIYSGNFGAWQYP